MSIDTSEIDQDWLRIQSGIARRLKRSYPWIEWDDLHGAAGLGLVQADRRYRKVKDTRGDRSSWVFFEGSLLAINELRACRDLLDKRARVSREKRGAPKIYTLSALATFSGLPQNEIYMLEHDKHARIAVDQEYFTPPSCHVLLKDLPTRLKVILLLRFDEGWNTREISEVFKCTPERIRQLMRQGLEQLITLIGEQETPLNVKP